MDRQLLGAVTISDWLEPPIRALLAEFPDMPSTVLMERVGWAGRAECCGWAFH
jgi:hypothetical protein